MSRFCSKLRPAQCNTKEWAKMAVAVVLPFRHLSQFPEQLPEAVAIWEISEDLLSTYGNCVKIVQTFFTHRSAPLNPQNCFHSSEKKNKDEISSFTPCCAKRLLLKVLEICHQAAQAAVVEEKGWEVARSWSQQLMKYLLQMSCTPYPGRVQLTFCSIE